VAGEAHGVGGDLRPQQLDDAEVEQLGYARGGDEDVGGLQIAMNHQVVVRIVNGITDDPKQVQTFVDGEVAAVTVFVDRLSVDEVHDQIGPTVIRHSRVE
jgi:hypothetical protein